MSPQFPNRGAVGYISQGSHKHIAHPLCSSARENPGLRALTLESSGFATTLFSGVQCKCFCLTSEA